MIRVPYDRTKLLKKNLPNIIMMKKTMTEESYDRK